MKKMTPLLGLLFIALVVYILIRVTSMPCEAPAEVPESEPANMELTLEILADPELVE